jgi:hypothetical protein
MIHKFVLEICFASGHIMYCHLQGLGLDGMRKTVPPCAMEPLPSQQILARGQTGTKAAIRTSEDTHPSSQLHPLLRTKLPLFLLLWCLDNCFHSWGQIELLKFLLTPTLHQGNKLCKHHWWFYPWTWMVLARFCAAAILLCCKIIRW